MTLSVAGWSFLVGAWVAILGMTAWCMVRLLRARTARPGDAEGLGGKGPGAQEGSR